MLFYCVDNYIVMWNFCQVYLHISTPCPVGLNIALGILVLGMATQSILAYLPHPFCIANYSFHLWIYIRVVLLKYPEGINSFMSDWLYLYNRNCKKEGIVMTRDILAYKDSCRVVYCTRCYLIFHIKSVNLRCFLFKVL